MMFCHIVDDFYLQGILAKMKQKSWWQEQTNNKLYEKDWIPALIIHGISWSFMIMLPCNIYFMFHNPDKIYPFIITFVWNVLIHCIIDHKKCNKFEINLVTDQTMHLFQIVITFITFILMS